MDSLSKENVEAIVKSSVRINVSEPDPELRIKSLFMDYRTLLRTREWDSIIKNNTKVAVEHICSLLKPTELRQTIESELSLAQYEIRKDWKKFYKYVVKCAIECDRYCPVKGGSEKIKCANSKRGFGSVKESDKKESEESKGKTKQES